MKENWSKIADLYTEEQIAAVLSEIGVTVVSETGDVFLAYCPFHRNTDTPSFAVNKDNGTYICFSPACDQRGNFIKLVMEIARLDIFPAKRLIGKFKSASNDLPKQVEDLLAKRSEIASFSQETINKMADLLWDSPAQEYMLNRGFTSKTLAHFSVGYSVNKGLVAVPVHDWQGNPVGVIGRTIKGKRFENSEHLPTKKTLFNIHRAKKIGESVIIVESAMDAMRIHQAGFPNVVATCGGFFTEYHQQLIGRFFNEIIIMTDMDDPEDHRSVNCKKCINTCTGHNPGRALGFKIVDSMRSKRIKWAATEYGIFYPHNAKDAGDMTEEEIQYAINNSISTAEYEIWRKELPDLARI